MRLGAAWMLIVLGAVAAAAQTPRVAPAQAATDQFFEQQRRIDDERVRRRLELAPAAQLFDIQYGGWIDYYGGQIDDGIQNSRLFSTPGMSVWTRIRIDDGAHEIFGRVRLRYNYWSPGDEYELQQDWIGPTFQQVWYQVDVLRALHMQPSGDPSGVKVRLGRQDTRFGTGYVLDLPLDAVQVEARIQDLRITGLIGRTIPSYYNIDSSEAVDSHSDRCFYGVQAEYEGFQGHVPFAYAIWQDDETDERPKDYFQNYSYDTFYAGLGSRGQIVKDLTYWAEGTIETGHSYGDGAFLSRDEVFAWGWDLGLEKVFSQTPTRPRIMGEYMFASGDGDRKLSPTNAAGGNRTGTKDSSFVAFGFRDTGVSAAFLNSNLHIFKTGASFLPLERIEFCRNLELGTNWFLYYKNAAGGAISNPLADEASGYVGWEMDYYLNWRMASDLSWTIRWGTFFPGSAFSDKSTQHTLIWGVTWSF